MWSYKQHARIGQIQVFCQKPCKNEHKIVIADRKFSLREIVESLKISENSVFTILHEHLSMRRLYPKQVPRLLKNNNLLRIPRAVWHFFDAIKMISSHDETWIQALFLEIEVERWGLGWCVQVTLDYILILKLLVSSLEKSPVGVTESSTTSRI